jgi:hypothetical protein
MFTNLIWFCGGMIAATIIWFFVLRNNKKHFNEWMNSTEDYFLEAIHNIEGLGEEASAKIDALFENLKNIKK